MVGDIFDEYDDIEQTYQKIDPTTFIVEGSVSIHDVKKITEIEIPDGDYDTLSGYLIEKLERFPNEGEQPIIETEDATYKIEEYEDRRILKVKICKNNPVSQDEIVDNDEEKTQLITVFFF